MRDSQSSSFPTFEFEPYLFITFVYERILLHRNKNCENNTCYYWLWRAHVLYWISHIAQVSAVHHAIVILIFYFSSSNTFGQISVLLQYEFCVQSGDGCSIVHVHCCSLWGRGIGPLILLGSNDAVLALAAIDRNVKNRYHPLIRTYVKMICYVLQNKERKVTRPNLMTYPLLNVNPMEQLPKNMQMLTIIWRNYIAVSRFWKHVEKCRKSEIVRERKFEVQNTPLSDNLKFSTLPTSFLNSDAAIASSNTVQQLYFLRMLLHHRRPQQCPCPQNRPEQPSFVALEKITYHCQIDRNQ